MRSLSRSISWSARFAAIVLCCGVSRGLAADTAGGVANWFETVAEAERLAEEEAGKQPKPFPSPPPAAAPEPSPGASEPPPRPAVATAPTQPLDLDELRALIDKRNRLVTPRLFDAVKKLAEGRRPTRQQTEVLKEWFSLYFHMRTFVPASRRDPNLAAVIVILEDAVRRRADFVEGRILSVPCLLYAGRSTDARKHLDEASRFLTERGLNPTPFGLDCCAGWLRLGEHGAVNGFIGVLKNPKVVPKDKITVFQAWLVAIYSWQTFRFNDAKEYFDKALLRAKAYTDAPMPAVQDLIADAAVFYLIAGNPATRDAGKGARLLDRIPEGNQSWCVCRARAALQASKAAAAQGDDAAALWEAAVIALQACRQDSLPTLDREIDEQLTTYRKRELWFRERPKPEPKPEPKPDGDASHRRFPSQLVDEATP